MAETETKQAEQESTTDRVVRLLSATYFQPYTDPLTGTRTARVLTARRGETISLTAAEEARLDDLDALLPEGVDPADAERLQAAINDAYRSARGDQQALERHTNRLSSGSLDPNADGGLVNVEAPVDAGVAELSAWIKSERPNVDDTVALAEGDPDRARRVLEAEQDATGGNPRAGVEAGLAKIIDG